MNSTTEQLPALQLSPRGAYKLALDDVAGLIYGFRRRMCQTHFAARMLY